MNARLEKIRFSNPLMWLIDKLGWFLESHTNSHDGPTYRRWCLRRHSGDSSRRLEKQRLDAVSGESYWFNRTCSKLCLFWRIGVDGHSLQIHWGVPFLFMHYLSFEWRERVWFAKYLRGGYGDDMDYGLTISTVAFEWCWAQDAMAWAADGSTGYHFFYDWDNLRERCRFTQFFSFEDDVNFTVPATAHRPASQHVMHVKYSDVVAFYQRPWNRKKNHSEYRVDITFTGSNKPPMFGGKGENAWDCSDDAIYDCRVIAPTALGVEYGETRRRETQIKIGEEAVKAYLALVDEKRQKYD